MKYTLVLVALLTLQGVFAQTLTGVQLLEKSIDYHDPQGNWPTFQGEFKVVLETPNNPERESIITIDLPQQYFNVSTVRDGQTSFGEIKNNTCRFSTEEDTTEEAFLGDKDCERVNMFKNYYTYLYGLPMKLKDPGTHIAPEVTTREFKGKEYLVLRVTYDEAIGSDIWQFYFDPSTYAMEIYQFFKGEDEQTGEYILLSDEMGVNGIKMPKDRAWYYNKNDGYLGTDRLKE